MGERRKKERTSQKPVNVWSLFAEGRKGGKRKEGREEVSAEIDRRSDRLALLALTCLSRRKKRGKEGEERGGGKKRGRRANWSPDAQFLNYSLLCILGGEKKKAKKSATFAKPARPSRSGAAALGRRRKGKKRGRGRGRGGKGKNELSESQSLLFGRFSCLFARAVHQAQKEKGKKRGGGGHDASA